MHRSTHLPLTAILLALPILGLTSCKKVDSQADPHAGHDAAEMAPTTPQKTVQQEWTCSMHPQIRRKEAGDCPICGMDLVPLRAVDALNVSTNNTVVQLMPGQSAVASIKTAPAEEKTISQNLQLYGEIKYIQNNHLDLTSFYPGRVEKVVIDFNTTEVKKGQTLLVLYSEEALADQEKYLQALRDRYLTTFYERDVVSAQIETIKKRLLKSGLTEADLKGLLEERKPNPYVTIRAARSGSIVGPIPHVGERLNLETVAFHITPLDMVWFTAKVFEADLSSLKLGQSAEIQTKARPGKSYRGKLVFIDRVLDPASRTVMARFEVKNPARELLPEMSGTATLNVEDGKKYVVIPASALIDTGVRKIVFVKIAPDSFEQRDVTTASPGGEGPSGLNDLISVTDGVKAGEEVVINGAFLIDAEAQLRGSGGSGQ
ncbi:MAG: efflux RND transporter periplasmic adaptor subunit [Verrucomicrobiae bacterium]|nr:efflux RND transporter periplasmic adaptor subunit [Verrucomicrobiae bacterium]